MPAVGAAISVFSGWLGGGSILATLTGRMLMSVAVSALSSVASKAFGKKPRTPGITTDYTTDGEAKPQTFILGWYATGGHMVCPPMSHGKSGKTPNAFLTYVIDLGDVPSMTLDKLIIDDTEVEFEALDQTIPLGGTVPSGKPDWWYSQQGLDPAAPNAGIPTITPGRPAIGKYAGKVWLRYHAGADTTADAYLMSAYGPGTAWDQRSKRPWQADMVGSGTCYAVVTFKLDREVFSGLPRLMFVMGGIPLYDPRKDTSVGGNGAQRWDQPSTWAPSRNPMVMAYNVFRGIPIAGGPSWGYGIDAADLPLAAWTPAMNTCDETVDGAARYRAGWEVAVDDHPADVLDELAKVACASFAEVGGVWKPRVGSPAAPVYFLTDDDILLDHDDTFTPFPEIDDTYNAVHASYPNPAELWQTKDAPPRYNATWEAADNSRRRVADLSMAACPYGDQVQRVMRAYIESEPRFRRHIITLPPDASALEALDCITWSSVDNGYDAKQFEIADVSEDPVTLAVTVSLREVDPTDYSWQPDYRLPTTTAPIDVVPDEPLVATHFTAEGIAVLDDSGKPRRPAARLRWGGWALDGVTQVQWEIRLASSAADVMRGVTADPEAGEILFWGGILPATAYQARILFIAGRQPSQWTGWVGFTTPNILVPLVDIDDTPPARPAAPALTAVLGKITATWAVPGADVAYSDLELTEGAGNPVYFQTGAARHEWAGVKPGVVYSVRRREVDRVGNKSLWSDAATISAVVDTIPPAAPTGLTVKAGFNSLWFDWARNTEEDFSHYEVALGTATAPTTIVASTTSPAWAALELPDAALRYARVRAVDTSGNASAWSATVSKTTVTPPKVTAADLKGIVDATSFAQGIEPVSIVTSLPSTKTTSVVALSGRLYRWDGAKYAPDVLGQDAVTAGTVAAGAINTRELAAGAVTARVMGIGDFTNQVPDNQLQDASSWTTSANVTVVPSTGQTWPKAKGWLRFTPSSAYSSASSMFFPVAAGDQFYASFQASFVNNAATAKAVSGNILFYKDDLSYVSSVQIAMASTNSARVYAIEGEVPAAASLARFIYAAAGDSNTGDVVATAPTYRVKAKGELIVDGVLKARHMAAEEVISTSAQIRSAIINDAHIANLSAAKLMAGTALAGSVTVAGTALSTIQSQANDPAARINAAATKIDPGKIIVSGSTTLADWRKGGDETRIDGGALSANTVSANKLEIGNRAITLTGIQFEHNKPGTNQCSWTAGTVRWINDAGVVTTTSISAGYTTWSSGVAYIYWVKGATALNATTSLAVAMGANVVCLATYEGDFRLDADYGRTVIDGDMIKTGTVTATNLTKTAALITDQAQMGSAVIGSAQIRDLSVDTLKIADQSITQFWSVNGSMLNISLAYPMRGVVFFGSVIEGQNYALFELQLNGTVVESMRTASAGDTFVMLMKTINFNAGANTLQFIIRGTSAVRDWRMALFGAYK
ncbi:phage tail protein [Paracoccus sp. p3-h83]|uniref:phage tail protein n=1 Tax=Paracoccus sp. p3-h83 TaxID=3342805 RepID=UPI0035BAEE4E